MENKFRRFLSLALALLMIVSLVPVSAQAEEVSNRTVYFTNSDGWSGTIRAYAFGNTDGQTTEYLGGWPGTAMTYVETNSYGQDIYSIEVSESATTIIFNDGSSQTDDLTLGTDNGFYKDGSYGTYAPTVYYVAGVEALCGEAWTPNADAMTYSDGIYTYTYENIEIGTYEFKITDGTWDHSWGKDGDNASVTVGAQSNVTISFNGKTREVTAKAVCVKHASHTKEGACTICGEAVEHFYENGEGLDKTCVCGVACPHATWTDAGTCVACDAVCKHENVDDSKCTVCKKCMHTMHSTEGKCSKCGTEVSHNYVDGTCSVCGIACSHVWGENSICVTCGMTCGHDWSDKSGICIMCSATCTHSYTDGACSVCGAADPDYEADGGETAAFVAQIGDQGYETLAAAIAEAQPDETVTLLADVTVDAYVAIDKAITLDLNGHSITRAGTADGACTLYITGSGITITDSQKPTDGSAHDAAVKNTGRGIAIYIVENAEVTLTNVNVVGSDMGICSLGDLTVKTNAYIKGTNTTSDCGDGIRVYGGTVTVNADGIVEAAAGGTAIELYKTAKVTMNGRIFAAQGNSFGIAVYGGELNYAGNITAGEGTAILVSNYHPDQSYVTNGVVNITGGEIMADVVMEVENVNSDTSYAPKVNISGGQMENVGQTPDAGIILTDLPNSVVSVTGGRFIMSDPSAYVAEGHIATYTGVWYEVSEKKETTPTEIPGTNTTVSGTESTGSVNNDVEAETGITSEDVNEAVNNADTSTSLVNAAVANVTVTDEVSNQAVEVIKEAYGEDVIDETTEVTIEIRPYLDMAVTSYAEGTENAPATLTLSIEAKYDVVAVVDNKEAKVATESGKTLDTTDEPITITVPLPEGFVTEGKVLKVKHTKGDELKGIYDAEVSADGKTATFINPNGFSEFELYTEDAGPMGDEPIAYVDADSIWGETWSNATESYELKFYNDTEFMGTTKLNPAVYDFAAMNGNVAPTWHISFDIASDTDTYWIQEWKVAPTLNKLPNRVELWVDGENVNEGAVQFNGPDSLNKIVALVAGSNDIVKGAYTTLADALNAAVDGDIIKLISDPDVAISAVGEVTGGRTVTITGTAQFDWTKGWLFVGRGDNEGDGKIIFDNAKITSSVKKNPAAYGIYVSGAKADGSTATGILEIKNSSIEVDYLRNQNTVEVDNSTLTVYGGFSISGRGASDAAGGVDATATIDIKNSSNVIVINENGMGVGYEGNGILNVVDSTFESTALTVANEEGTSFNVSGESTLNIATLSGNAVNAAADTVLVDAVVGGKVVALGNLTFMGDATVKTLSATNGGDITIEEGKTLALNNFSFGAKANATAEYTITGGTITANYGFFQHGTYALHSDFETGYMYYSYGSDITVYGTFHSKGAGDGLDYVRGKLTIAEGGKSIHDKALWVGQPESWGAMTAALVIEDGGYVEAGSLSVYAGSSMAITCGNAAAVKANTVTAEGTITIDATKLVTTEPVMVIDVAEGKTVDLTNITVNGAAAKVVDGDLYVYAVAYVDLDKDETVDAGELFGTVEAAVAAAKDGDIVKVLADNTITETIEITGKAVTITADNAVTLTTEVTDVFTVGAGGKLTLGANLTVNSNTSILWAKDGGEITVAGAALNGNGATYATALAGAGSTITITDGCIYSEGESALAAEGAGAVVNINGGTVSTNTTAVRAAAYALYGGKVVVDGGTVASKNANATSYALVAGGDSTVIVKNGTVSGTNGAIVAHGASTAKAIIENGTIYGAVTEKNGADVAISGGTFDRVVPENCCEPGYSPVTEAGADGKYTVKLGYILDVNSGKNYGTIAEALNAAEAGTTLKLLQAHTESMVVVNKGITLDLNGQTLTAGYVVVFNGNHLVDSGTTKGLLKVAKDKVSLPVNNAQMPVWNEVDGYCFVPVNADQKYLNYPANALFLVGFRPDFSTLDGVNKVANEYFVDDGAANNDIHFQLRLSWTGKNGNDVYQTFIFNDDLVKQVYKLNKALTLTVSSIGAIESLDIQVIVVSATGVQAVSETMTYPAVTE